MPNHQALPPVHVVLVHGIRASGSAWKQLMDRFANDDEMSRLQVHTFEYFASGIDLMRKSPTQREVAMKLESFIATAVPEGEPFIMIGHSQGGLIIQRWIVNCLQAARAEDPGHDRRDELRRALGAREGGARPGCDR